MRNKLRMVVLLLPFALCLTGCYNGAKERAVQEFRIAVQTVEGNNKKLQNGIARLEGMIDSGKPPLDPGTVEQARAAVSEARRSLVEIPQLPENAEDIAAQTEKLQKCSDCTRILDLLDAAGADLSASIRRMKQVTNPNYVFIENRLLHLEHITEIDAVTHDHDPQGRLGEEGGYTSCLYFSTDQIDQNQVPGYLLIDKGTAAGGSIEVYASQEDAQARISQLLQQQEDDESVPFGTCLVCGTVVIMVSALLTKKQQIEMEETICESLTRLSY